MSDVDLRSFLTNERPVQVVLKTREMEEPYSRGIAKEFDLDSYAHTNNVVDILKKNGVIREEEQRGRKTVLGLTEDGEKLADALENLYEVLEKKGDSDDE